MSEDNKAPEGSADQTTGDSFLTHVEPGDVVRFRGKVCSNVLDVILRTSGKVWIKTDKSTGLWFANGRCRSGDEKHRNDIVGLIKLEPDVVEVPILDDVESKIAEAFIQIAVAVQNSSATIEQLANHFSMMVSGKVDFEKDLEETESTEETKEERKGFFEDVKKMKRLLRADNNEK